MQILTPAAIPSHIAIIMDGNRRWASQRGLPRAIGHASGARRVRQIVEACSERGVSHLTLFAFSTENWQRPADEVSSLMSLLVNYLQKEICNMHTNGVRLKIVGDLSRFDQRLQNLMASGQALTSNNSKISLTIAANYGGRWDIVQAVKAWQATNPAVNLSSLDEAGLRPHLSMGHAPDPDLLIRTGGESRISNFLLWQMAYTELFFTDKLWPDFSVALLDEALHWYSARDRRFGASSVHAQRAK
ncbi:polyprenyl diphosphate synthase [Comamonas aquatica]|uniref:Isoprenyl transferase n=1 Tax=Comamonas aquatica TaxID=225991 RepID=A0AA42HUE4_9BURK|nr:polyprenyl diphosphate synthase [Comamonas aquatica]MDH0364481.1 polyprenyl diphosphate synthase [Comamonas aquatica]